MRFRSLVLPGYADQYHRINFAEGKSAAYADDDDEASALPGAEEDEVPLLKATVHCTNCHSEVDAETVVACINAYFLNQIKFAFNNRRVARRKKKAIIPLRIRKLDSTSFALEVPANATVMELKRILQQKFDSTCCNISWPHVWGNFCLSFNNQKLLDHGKHLHQLGIGRGDDLYFVRHVTNSSGQWDCQRQSFFTSMRRKRPGLPLQKPKIVRQKVLGKL